jgi:hypothetical protein
VHRREISQQVDSQRRQGQQQDLWSEQRAETDREQQQRQITQRLGRLELSQHKRRIGQQRAHHLAWIVPQIGITLPMDIAIGKSALNKEHGDQRPGHTQGKCSQTQAPPAQNKAGIQTHHRHQ